jgi:hypothetical protein
VPYIFCLETSKKKYQLPPAGREALFQEMKKGRLRQGWGGEGMSLIDDNGRSYSGDEWVKNYLGRSKDKAEIKKARGHYRLLSAMLQIRPGDLIVVPNFGEDGWDGLVIAKAVHAPGRPKGEGECYDFSPLVPPALNGDRRHFVAIERLFKAIPLSRTGKHLKSLITKGGYRVRVRQVNSEKHKELMRTITRLAEADIVEETETIKNAKVAKPPDDKQRERGLKGEKEVEERLREGFQGFTFKANRTKDGCGYDFLAHHGKREVEIEVKSFDARSGQIFLTQKEFERAQKNAGGYHLWVLLDNGGDPSTWDLWTLPSPHSQLEGVADRQVTIVYRVAPGSVKWEKRFAGPETPRRNTRG